MLLVLWGLLLSLGLFLNTTVAAQDKCPQTLSEWQETVNTIAEDLSPYSMNYSKSLPRNKKAQGYLDKLDLCQKQWKERRGEAMSQQTKACTQRVTDFLKASLNFYPTEAEDGKMGPDRSLGFNVPDKDYYSKADKYVAIPAELKTQEFLQAISRPLKDEGVKKALAYIDKLNTERKKTGDEEIVAFYFPTKLGNFESWQRMDAWRLFVRWPGNPIRFIQFATHETAGGSGQTSVVSVHEDESGTLHTYIKDHWREIPKEGDIKLPHVTKGIFKGNACINCHQSGPRQIDPSSWTAMDEPTKKKIRAVNREFASMSGMQWGGFYDVDSNALGPPMGELVAGQKRDAAFFDACTEEAMEREKKYPRSGVNYEDLIANKEKIYSKLEKSMDCTQCHDGSTRGPIHLPFDPKLTAMKIYNGDMPPGNTLTEFERILLRGCLEAEMFGYWKKKRQPGTIIRYLTGVACGDEKKAEATQSTHPKEDNHR